MIKTILMFICFLGFNSGQILFAQVKTIKDSLLEMYSMEELRSMTSRERGNIIRQLRGQEPILLVSPESKFDRYGIKVVENIPVDSSENAIKVYINQINSEKAGYRQEVFPNAWRDVVDGYGLRFYNSFSDRTVSEEAVQTITTLINETGQETPFSNFSKRVYYFDGDDDLKLITREMGYNINEGRKYQWDYRPPLVYTYEEYYIQNNQLQYVSVLMAEQIVSGYPDYSSQEGIDTTLVSCQAFEGFFYKDNSFNYSTKEGAYEPMDWKSEFTKVPLAKQPSSANGPVISLRNLVLEREEYYEKRNDFLISVPTSFLGPYVIER